MSQRNRLPELLAQLRTWLDLPDPGPTIASCAAAATVPLDGEEAAWLLNVAAPSAGKRSRQPPRRSHQRPTQRDHRPSACSAGPAARNHAQSASSPASPATPWSHSATCLACRRARPALAMRARGRTGTDISSKCGPGSTAGRGPRGARTGDRASDQHHHRGPPRRPHDHGPQRCRRRHRGRGTRHLLGSGSGTPQRLRPPRDRRTSPPSRNHRG